MTRPRLAALVACLLAVSVQAGAGTLPLAKTVDLNRMYGGWYIVATIPNGFERGMVSPYDVYAPRRDGSIQEDFYMRRGGFDAPLKHFRVRDWIRPGTGDADWRVQPFWPLSLPFLLIYTDPQYRFVLFGEDSRKLGWIYSRTRAISDADYAMLLDRFAALGFDKSLFRKLIQTPDQIGRSGYWSDAIHPSRPPRTKHPGR